MMIPGAPECGIRVPRLVVPFLIGDLLMAALYVANVTVFPGFGLSRRLFHLGHENNIPTWFSTVQLFTVAIVMIAFAVGMVRQREPRARWLFAWAALFLFLSLDEMAMVHERMPEAIKAAFFPVTGAWMLVMVPILGLLVLGLGLVTRRFWLPHRDIALMFGGGFALFAIAAGGIEVLTNYVATTWQLHLQIFAEEIGEMVAVTVILWASHRLLERHGLALAVTDRVP
jgi:hypothetical protein